MNILIHADEREQSYLSEVFSCHGAMQFRRLELTACADYDSYIEALEKGGYDLVVVAADGACGMESVIAVRNASPELPVIWFSDDADFGVQSYRLGCSYFGVKPVTSEKLQRAMERC